MSGALSAARARSALLLAASVALAVAVGFTAALARIEVALVVAGGLLGLATLRNLPLSAWCILLLLTTVVMRGVVTTFGLPQSLNFLHYPVTVGLAIAALQRPHRASARAPAAWLAGFLLVTLASLLANLSHPLRGALFLLIVGEPLVIIWALSRWRVSSNDQSLIVRAVIVLAALQIPIGVLQAGSGGWGDAVQGTLLGHGAGHHVLGALFALGLLAVVAGLSARTVGLGAGVAAAGVSLGMMLATGSIAVTVLTGLAVMTVPLARTNRAHRGRRPRISIKALAAATALGIVALFLAQTLVPDVYDRAARLVQPDTLPEARLLAERADEGVGVLVLGSGPGTTASRASTLLIGAREKGSPLALLGLEPTDEALEVWYNTRDEHGGSAEALASSALAIIGDLGALGLAALTLLFLRMWREVSRSPHPLAPAARGALVLTAMLMFVSNWLEFPEYTVPLSILIGLVLSQRPVRAGRPEPALAGTRPVPSPPVGVG